MKLKNKILLLIGCATAIQSVAQDAQLSQFFNSPMYLNPALAGSSEAHRFSLAYRNQWPGVKKSYATYVAGYDYNFYQQNVGLGGYVMQDMAGTGNLVTTQAALNLSYRVETGRTSEVRGGLQLGYGQKKTDISKLVFNDQFITGSSVSEDAGTVNSKNYLDVGAGAIFKSEDFWGGIAFRHMNKPNVSLNGATSALPMYTTLHGGYRLVIQKPDSSNGKERSSLNFVASYRHELKNDQVDLGAYYFYKLVNFGVIYRGIPIKTYGPGYNNNESIALLAGVDLPQKIKIWYSYDITISTLNMHNSAGAHEINLGYEFGKAKGKKIVNKRSQGTKVRRKF